MCDNLGDRSSGSSSSSRLFNENSDKHSLSLYSHKQKNTVWDIASPNHTGVVHVDYTHTHMTTTMIYFWVNKTKYHQRIFVEIIFSI